MSISVECPGCDHSFDASEEHAGTEVSCPECEKPVPVPERDTVVSPEGSEEELERTGQFDQKEDKKGDPVPGESEGEGRLTGRFDLILKAIRVGLRPKKVGLSAAGMFLATLVFCVFSILGINTGSAAASLSFSLIGALISLGIAFQLFAALSHMSLAELKGHSAPDWNEIVSYLSGSIGPTLLIPFGLLTCTAIVLLLEFLLGWIGVIPYIGGIFLFGLAIAYLFLNIGILILLVLSLWLTFPHQADRETSLISSVQSLYQDIRRRFGDYLMDLTMVLVLMMVFVWVIGSFCAGAFYMTSGTLFMQTSQFVENTFQEDGSALGGDEMPDFGNLDRRSRNYGPMNTWFGQLIFAVIISILSGVIQGPLLSVFYTGGCAAYLSNR